MVKYTLFSIKYGQKGTIIFRIMLQNISISNTFLNFILIKQTLKMYQGFYKKMKQHCFQHW